VDDSAIRRYHDVLVRLGLAIQHEKRSPLADWTAAFSKISKNGNAWEPYFPSDGRVGFRMVTRTLHDEIVAVAKGCTHTDVAVLKAELDALYDPYYLCWKQIADLRSVRESALLSRSRSVEEARSGVLVALHAAALSWPATIEEWCHAGEILICQAGGRGERHQVMSYGRDLVTLLIYCPNRVLKRAHEQTVLMVKTLCSLAWRTYQWREPANEAFVLSLLQRHCPRSDFAVHSRFLTHAGYHDPMARAHLRQWRELEQGAVSQIPDQISPGAILHNACLEVARASEWQIDISQPLDDLGGRCVRSGLEEALQRDLDEGSPGCYMWGSRSYAEALVRAGEFDAAFDVLASGRAVGRRFGRVEVLAEVGMLKVEAEAMLRLHALGDARMVSRRWQAGSLFTRAANLLRSSSLKMGGEARVLDTRAAACFA
jgi:hypothetical protein